jgi:hypothetical protein
MPKKTAFLPLIALAFMAIALTVVTAGVLVTQSVHSSGTVTGTTGGNSSGASSGGSSGSGDGGITTNTVNLALFSDANASVPLSNVEWGSISAGTTSTKTIYIKNTGNVAETLSLSGAQWNPVSASTVLTLSWNKESVSLTAGQVVAATLSLTVAADPGDLDSFSLNIVVSGTA